jgi:hypothetical protein
MPTTRASTARALHADKTHNCRPRLRMPRSRYCEHARSGCSMRTNAARGAVSANLNDLSVLLHGLCSGQLSTGHGPRQPWLGAHREVNVNAATRVPATSELSDIASERTLE